MFFNFRLDDFEDELEILDDVEWLKFFFLYVDFFGGFDWLGLW